MKSFFVFSHNVQIRYYSVFAQALKEYKPNVKLVLFVHGKEEVEIGKQTETFDLIIDLLNGFTVDENTKTKPNKLIIEIENEYGSPFIWEDIKIDRWLKNVNSNVIIQYLNHSTEILIKSIEELNPILGFGEFTRAIYRFAKRKFNLLGIDFLHFEACRYFNRFLFHDNFNWNNKKINNYYNYFLDHPNEIPKKIIDLYDNILKGNTKISYQTNFMVSTGYNMLTLRSTMKKTINYLFIQTTFIDKNNPLTSINDRNFFTKIKRVINQRLNALYYNKIIEKKVDLDIKYSIYYLHYQPEYTVEGLGTFYMDQSFLIENIASALPVDQVLYVKEHRPMIGLRSKEFYKRICKNKNVILIDHKYNSLDLVKNAQLVFSIVGTVALEAMYFGKPSIVFGKYFGDTKFIKFCNSFWELKTIISNSTKGNARKTDAKLHSTAYLAARYKVSKKGHVPLSEKEIPEFLNDRKNIEVVKKSMIEELKGRGI